MDPIIKKWLLGLVGVVCTTVGKSITVVILDPATFNVSTGWRSLLVVTGVALVFAVGNWLQDSPFSKKE